VSAVLQHTLVEQLRFNAAAFGGRPALQVVGGAELSYAEALDRTLVLATAIREHTDGAPVAILHRNGPDAALSFLACQLAGVAAVPVNNVLTPTEMDYLLDDSSVGVLLHGPEFTDLVPALSPARKPAVVCSADAGPRHEPWESFTTSDPAAPFIIGYTSGTTGFPKGAVYDGEGMYVQYLRWAVHFGLSPDSTLLTAGPMFHNSYGGLSLLALALGATNRILASFDADLARAELGAGCTFAFLVPAMLAQVLRSWRDAGRPPLTALRRLLSSGSAADPAQLGEAFEAFPEAMITEAYGWSEGGWVTHEAKARGAIVPHSVGHPMVGADVALFGPDGAPCGPGETGEIGVRNVTPFLGYVNPASPHDTSADGRYLLSGDIGRFAPDGRLLLVDRKKDIIVTGGENVASGEVERVLAAHPAVRDVAVVGRADERWGEAVTAIVVLEPDATDVDSGTLRTHCRAQLAAYKVPKQVEFAAALPRNSMGKVQKFLLRQLPGHAQ
jgi:acyl-CoA synthetase (AMP-forming)/AMP-acid ligase II